MQGGVAVIGAAGNGGKQAFFRTLHGDHRCSAGGMTDDNCTRGACDRRIPRRDDPDHGDPDLEEAAFFLSPAPKNTDERCNEGNYASPTRK
jgi:hypothetical protein